MSKTTQKTIRKKRRRIRKSILLIPLFIVAAIAALVFYPRFKTDRTLQEMGYTEEQIQAVREEDLQHVIINSSYYSPYLAESIAAHTLNRDYISLYAAVKEGRTLNEKDFLLARRLQDMGYEQDQIENLFANLEFWEMTPLLVYDYQWDENGYIEDCLAHHSENSVDRFVLDGLYRSMYKTTAPAENTGSAAVLVNRTYYLSEEYEPEDLTEISMQYAVYGMYLRKEAAEAAQEMCAGSVNGGSAFFIASSYWDYASLDYTYQMAVNQMPKTEADWYTPRAGHSEHQTGLCVNLAATYETSVDFADSSCRQWLKTNSASYGFIERYPQGKEEITGMEPEPEHYRYVGKDIARMVQASRLTFDEYYCLYLKSWRHAECMPDSSVTSKINEYSAF